MGDGTKEKPYTRRDVLRLKKENRGKAEGLDLSGKEFKKGIDLRKLNLRGIVLKNSILEEAHFEGDILAGAHLEDAWLADAHLESTDLEEVHFEGAWLMGAHLEGAYLGFAHLEGANLQFAHLQETYLEDTEISYDTKLENANWGNYILEEERTGYSAQETYQRLKMWYTQHGIYDVAAKFYYREKEATRKALKWCSKSSFRHRLALQASYLVFGHGEDWKRVLYWMAGIILGLAVIYFFLGAFSPGTFPGCLYYSVASFTALGYGSWVSPEPESWAKGLGAAEALIGISMMALLLVTFVRKWTR